MSEPELQSRMIFQVGDRANAKFLCAASRHHESVSVVETKRFGHTDPGLSELIGDLLKCQSIAAFQNFVRNRAGVFGINVDLPAAQRFPKNDGAAHSLAMFGGN